MSSIRYLAGCQAAIDEIFALCARPRPDLDPEDAASLGFRHTMSEIERFAALLPGSRAFREALDRLPKSRPISLDLERLASDAEQTAADLAAPSPLSMTFGACDTLPNLVDAALADLLLSPATMPPRRGFAKAAPLATSFGDEG